VNGRVALLLCFLAAPAAAERNDFDLEHYVVHGATARALRAELDAKGPLGETGRRGDGYTRWSISWTYGLDFAGGVCTASRINVDLSIHMILPRWEKASAPEPGLVALWNRYFAALRVHEDGHRDLAVSAAREVRRALARERGAADCEALKKRMNSKANSLLDRLRRDQAAYDRATDDGKKQGVRLP
jgi:predicted secreted Zn-dependent protease